MSMSSVADSSEAGEVDGVLADEVVLGCVEVEVVEVGVDEAGVDEADIEPEAKEGVWGPMGSARTSMTVLRLK